MKKTAILSMVAATVLFTGCSEETKQSASQTVTAAVETTQSAVKDATEVVTDTAEKAMETSKEVVQKAKEKVTEMMDAESEVAAASEETAKVATSAIESAEEAATTSATADNEAGKTLYAKCAACHGADGKRAALNKSAIIAGQSAAELEIKIVEYKAGTREVNGMGNLMSAQVATMSDEEIKAVSEYIATF